MNFGQNLYQWFLSNAQSLVLMAIVVIGIYLGFNVSFPNLSASCSCLDCCRLGVQCWWCERCTVRAVQQDYWCINCCKAYIEVL